MRTAGLISRGIVLATSAITTGMSSASNYYISHSNPTAKPVQFSPRTRANVQRIHKISGTAVTVTAKTTGAILKNLDHVANRLMGSSSKAGYTGNPGYQPQLAPPPLPPRSGSPGYTYPRRPDGAYPSTPSAGMPPPLPARKPRLLNKLLASTNLLVTTLERSATQLMDEGTNAISASLGHRYGREMGDASRMAGQSARNVGLVYIDVRGVGHRALLKRAGVAVVKARMGGRDVVLGPQSQAMQSSGPPYPGVVVPSVSSPPEYTPSPSGGPAMSGSHKKD